MAEFTSTPFVDLRDVSDGKPPTTVVPGRVRVKFESYSTAILPQLDRYLSDLAMLLVI